MTYRKRRRKKRRGNPVKQNWFPEGKYIHLHWPEQHWMSEFTFTVQTNRQHCRCDSSSNSPWTTAGGPGSRSHVVTQSSRMVIQTGKARLVGCKDAKVVEQYQSGAVWVLPMLSRVNQKAMSHPLQDTLQWWYSPFYCAGSSDEC